MKKHATVKIGGFTIPLIGVAPDATEGQCAKCRKTKHITELALWQDGQFYCQACSQQRPMNK